MLKWLALAGASALLLACSSSSSEDVLELRGVDIGPDAYRTHIRSLFAQEVGSLFVCNSIKGLTPSEAVDALTPDGEAQEEPELVAKGTPQPGQAPVREDAERAMEIVIEECERID